MSCFAERPPGTGLFWAPAVPPAIGTRFHATGGVAIRQACGADQPGCSGRHRSHRGPKMLPGSMSSPCDASSISLEPSSSSAFGKKENSLLKDTSLSSLPKRDIVCECLWRNDTIDWFSAFKSHVFDATSATTVWISKPTTKASVSCTWLHCPRSRLTCSFFHKVADGCQCVQEKSSQILWKHN